MKKPLLTAALTTALLLTTHSTASDTTSTAPAGARAYILSPVQGARVTSPVTVVFGLDGMGIAPAGTHSANTGHHHLLVDTELPADLNAPLGADVKHFGGGQTQTRLELTPGPHSLQLLLGDHLHRPHQPPVFSKKITIIVE